MIHRTIYIIMYPPIHSTFSHISLHLLYLFMCVKFIFVLIYKKDESMLTRIAGRACIYIYTMKKEKEIIARKGVFVIFLISLSFCPTES